MISRFLLAAFALMFVMGTANADQRWQRVEAVTQALDNRVPELEGLSLELPLVAEDGSSVALSVSFTGSLEDGEHIEKVRLFAPGNPRPEVADITLSALASPANIATRIRLSETQQVVALAITNQDRAFLTTRDVRVTVSGCLVGGGDASAIAMANPRLALAGSVRKSQPVTVRSLINHPMETGLRPDGQADDSIEQQLVESLTATLNDEPVLTARFFTGTSANPYLQFQLTPEEEGELKLVWQDQEGEQMEASQPIRF
ncbi:thiosulfate oxidation carrier complex protein SoxZ [Marinobacter shengliensis]|jgi:sulfur-oxidizing protein SoxY|uniref:thiosulfate oxidation carrier complex protein SoxZ n=1 Tax=Marinobacter shengliensis TaxID=1389223 RepID=UPI002572EE2B|nr:thiosulfate oxidation carrier complex protein SoxZ [Marinobacter shengliensis]BEH16152.1 hypothetical protein MAALD49_35200 [Marinobacter shengliensis]